MSWGGTKIKWLNKMGSIFSEVLRFKGILSLKGNKKNCLLLCADLKLGRNQQAITDKKGSWKNKVKVQFISPYQDKNYR